jgi:hypothetical protein
MFMMVGAKLITNKNTGPKKCIEIKSVPVESVAVKSVAVNMPREFIFTYVVANYRKRWAQSPNPYSTVPISKGTKLLYLGLLVGTSLLCTKNSIKISII